MNRFSQSALAFGGGVALGLVVDLHLLRPLLAFAALVLGLLSLPALGRPKLARALVIIAFAFGGSSLPARPPTPSLPPPGLYRLEVQTARVDHGARGTWTDATVLAGERIEDCLPVEAGVTLRLRGALPPEARVRTLARLEPVPRFRNRSPVPPPPARAVHVRGRVVGRADALYASPWARRIDGLRTTMRQHLVRSLPPGASGVARALVLGDRGAVDDERRDAVRGAGLAHVLAVSGLHVAVSVGLFVLFAAATLRRIPPLARRFATEPLAFAAGVPAALLYAELAGAAPSARRAAITAALAFGLRALGRRPSPLPLALAAIALLAILHPEELTDPGLLLSVLATLAIVSGLGPTPSDPWSRFRVLARVSMRASVATAPMIWWCFGAVPLVGVAANVLLAPLASALLIPAALLHASVGALHPAAGAATAFLFTHVEMAFSSACALFAEVPWGRALAPPTLVQLMVACAGAAAFLLARRGRQALGALLATALLLLAAEALVRANERKEGELRVTFVDVGQGDAILVDAPDGTTLLIDGGGGAARPGLRALLPLLSARRVARLDVVALTHPHPDHYEGLADLVGRIPIGELWDSGQGAAETPEGPVARLLGRARTEGTRVSSPRHLCGAPRRFGALRLAVLAPCPGYDPGYDPNDNSLVLSLRYGARSFLLVGDAEAHEESILTAMGDAIHADVLKVGHHGSRTSSTPRFIDAVRPALCIVSAGTHNRYGHPHPEVYARLARVGRVLTTAKDGGVEVITNGRTLRVRPFHGPSFRLPLSR